VKNKKEINSFRMQLLLFMKLHKVGQAKLAKRVGISQSYVSKILAGKLEPRLSTAISVAKKCGVSLEEWCGL